MPNENNNHTKLSACRHNLIIYFAPSKYWFKDLQCVFEYVSYDIACKYILLQKAITKSSSFLRKGKSAISFLHVVINNSKIDWFELFSTMI